MPRIRQSSVMRLTTISGRNRISIPPIFLFNKGDIVSRYRPSLRALSPMFMRDSFHPQKDARLPYVEKCSPTTFSPLETCCPLISLPISNNMMRDFPSASEIFCITFPYNKNKRQTELLTSHLYRPPPLQPHLVHPQSLQRKGNYLVRSIDFPPLKMG